MRAILSFLLALSLLSGLSACGRKGAPEEPEGTVYPRVYPYTPFPAKPERKASEP